MYENAMANWTMHPNPASDEVQLTNVSAGMRFLVKDAAGRVVRSGAASGLHWTWDASDLPVGMYWVQEESIGISFEAKPLWIVR